MSPPATLETHRRLKELIRDIPDFPKPGIVYRDITPLLADAAGLRAAIRQMAEPWHDQNIDLIVGAESRGFIFGTSIARELNCGFVPVRKKGKLPAQVITEEYELEYGTDHLQIHVDAIQPKQRILVVDDLLATGGTLKACCDLVKQLDGEILGISVLIELSSLNGRRALSNYDVHSLITYDAE